MSVSEYAYAPPASTFLLPSVAAPPAPLRALLPLASPRFPRPLLAPTPAPRGSFCASFRPPLTLMRLSLPPLPSLRSLPPSLAPPPQLILDNSQNPYAQLLAASSLVRLVSDNALTPQLRLDIRNYVLTFLFNRGPGLAPFVATSLVQLLARVTKLGWFDVEAQREIVKAREGGEGVAWECWGGDALFPSQKSPSRGDVPEGGRGEEGAALMPHCTHSQNVPFIWGPGERAWPSDSDFCGLFFA